MKNKAKANAINTIDEIRRVNLCLLIQDNNPPTAKAVAEKCGTAASYLSQILIRYEMTSGKSREVGTELARKLEVGCKKPLGWMDVIHEEGEVPTHEIVNLYLAMDNKMRSVLIQQAKMILQITKK